MTIFTRSTLTCLFFYLFTPVFSQITLERTYTELPPGNITNPRFQPNGGYVMALSDLDSAYTPTGNFIFQSFLDDLVRTDDLGNILWTWTDSSDAYPEKYLEVLSNGDILMVMSALDVPGKNIQDELIAHRFSESGQLLWTRSAGVSGKLYDPQNIIELPNGEIVIIALSNPTGFALQEQERIFFKLDANGNVLTFNSELLPSDAETMNIRSTLWNDTSIVQIRYNLNENYYLTFIGASGTTLSTDSITIVDPSTFRSGVPVVLDDRSIAFLSERDPPATLAADTRYIRLDSNAQVLNDTANSPFGLGASGTTLVHRQGALFTVTEAQGAMFARTLVLRKLNPDGSEVWGNTFSGGSTNLYRRAYSLDVAPNGDLLFAGTRNPTYPNGSAYPYLVRTNLDGLLPTEDPVWSSFSIFPNPTTGRLRIDALEIGEGDVFSVLDLQGKTVLTPSNESELDLSALNNGIYLVRWKRENGRSLTRKVIVQH